MERLFFWLRKIGSLRMAKLPTIPASALEAASSDADYLTVFIEAYELQEQATGPLLGRFISLTNEAFALLMYGKLHSEVENGGFIQLIQNGNGTAIFDSPLAQDLTRWGAAPLALLVEQAAFIYRANIAYLERSRTIPEFSAMYKEFTAFEPLEDHFYDIIDSQVAVIRAHVAGHLGQFAHVA